MRGVNESVDPCENFYEFACGSWKKNHPIPPYTPVWGRPYMFQQMVYHRLKGIYNNLQLVILLWKVVSKFCVY